MNGGEFVMPEIWIGCPVEASVGKSRGPYTLGAVIRAKKGSADIVLAAEGSVGFMYDCWHDDDPRVETAGAGAWEDNTRGTWRLTRGEIERRKMIEQVNRMAAELARQARRLEALEETRPEEAPEPEPAVRPAPLDEIKSRPGRGRPRKPPIPLSEIRPLTRVQPQFSDLAVEGQPR